MSNNSARGSYIKRCQEVTQINMEGADQCAAHLWSVRNDESLGQKALSQQVRRVYVATVSRDHAVT